MRHNTSTINAFAKLGVLLFTLMGAVSLYWYLLDPMMLFIAVGCLSGAIMLLPAAVQPRYDLFSTWSLAALSVFLGTTIRGFYIAFEHPDQEIIDFLFLRGNPPEYFFWPSILLLGCLVMAALGYLVQPSRPRKMKPLATELQTSSLDDRKLYFFAFFALGTTLFCVYLYIDLTGGFDSLSLSKKRTLIENLNLSETHRTWQSIRTVASISMLAHLSVLACALQPEAKNRSFKIWLSIVLLIAACILPFYASSRGTIITYIIFSLAVIHYTTRRLALRRIFLAAITVLLLFQAMSISRSASNLSVSEIFAEISLNTRIFDKLVVNRNELEVAKTAHIISAIPDTLELQYGKTIGVWLLAPIPREIWNAKPLISPGPIIGTKIYGNRRSGIPPGFVGEMYWNFHILGVLLGGLLLGIGLRWLHERFHPRSPGSIEKTVIYVAGPMQAGYLILGTSVGYGILTAAMNTIIAFAVLKLFLPKAQLMSKL